MGTYIAECKPVDLLGIVLVALIPHPDGAGHFVCESCDALCTRSATDSLLCVNEPRGGKSSKCGDESDLHGAVCMN